jgi:hypothetical protein
MKKLALCFAISLFVPFIFAVTVHAENTLFVSATCPHCQNVEATITANGEIDSAKIVLREVTSNDANRALFIAALDTCGISQDNAGVPMLYVASQCYVGEDKVLAQVSEIAANTVATTTATTATTVTDNVASSNLPVVNPGIPKEEAQRNTLIFIGIMVAFLVGLVALGYWKQNSSGIKTKKLLVPFLMLAILTLNVGMLVYPLQVEAFCPVCTIAIGAGLGVSKSLGIDDIITSLWIGGLLVSSSLWIIEWTNKKNIRFFFRKPLAFILMYGLTIWPLAATKIIGTTYNTLWGVDKVLLGIIIGTIAFIIGHVISNILVKNNEDKVYFPFQKVVFPLSALILMSLVFFFIVY